MNKASCCLASPQRSNLRGRSILAAAVTAGLLLAACEDRTQSASDAAPVTSIKLDSPSANAPGASASPGAAATASPPANGAIAAPEDVAAPPADAAKTTSGLASKVITKGTGEKHPKAEDRVEVHYTGWTKDGAMFDSSKKRGTPATFPLNGVIKGWTEGVQLMVEGETRRFWIPADLAYGEKATRPGAPTGQLTFDIELLKIIESPPPPEVPADVAKPPATAKKTASGLAYRVLTPGTGKAHPKPTDRVLVHYSGWTTDGKMFDSSVTRGEPTGFRLNQVIKGWTEGLQLMVAGEKTRFWIPADLAYGDKPTRPGAPSGQLTFDVELIEIQ